MTSTKTDRPTRFGKKSAYDRQVSSNGRRLLVWLVQEKETMTSDAQRLELQNCGIPWHLGDAAAELGIAPPSLARTLSLMEKRCLVFCWANGQKTGRRISHIKLTVAAERLAAYERQWGRSPDQMAREASKNFRRDREELYAELDSLDGWPDPQEGEQPDEEQLKQLNEAYEEGKSQEGWPEHSKYE
ncbi:hypothetical protein [Deinococcus aquaticus]|uniref:hypothetical protein n=1 Tax=Deinococcus aquaticus TaxID=328692 RepID=UPI003F48F6B1